MNECMIKITDVTKTYKLGQIGSTTLREDLNRFNAKLLKKPDPTQKIGAKPITKNEIFNALDGVSLTVNKGEKIGIIGHNGAGKSTLLKLISRVTGPTKGEICLNGKVSSMLEIGTGFHPELTGKENIYLNGAILGMTKKEIDEKIDDIIDFSELRQFIDTPTKRYSSGMYVKLAFAVAAFLNSDILIMDEVLAVGDLSFQNKCINKINSVANETGRTVLFVSHNMDTIRKLCDRTIVLSDGKIVFDGDTEDAIRFYIGNEDFSEKTVVFENKNAKSGVFLDKAEILSHDGFLINENEKVKVKLTVKSDRCIKGLSVRCPITAADTAVGLLNGDNLADIKAGESFITLTLDTSLLSPDTYKLSFVLYEQSETGGIQTLDKKPKAVTLLVNGNAKWSKRYWGNVKFPDIKAE